MTKHFSAHKTKRCAAFLINGYNEKMQRDATVLQQINLFIRWIVWSTISEYSVKKIIKVL